MCDTNYIVTSSFIMRFEVITVASMKMAVFWFYQTTRRYNPEEYEDGCLLGCCTVQSGRSLPTFQRCLLPHLPDDGGSKHL
jgi:hypothetical protein